MPQDIPLDIVYEDDHLLVVNKPKGMVVHPAPGNPDGTLVNALLWHCKGSLSGIGGEIRPGIVHRIDRDTSGLLIAGYKVLERFGGFTLLECRLKTGRTHQIRVHMASIQHPVAGDPVYGPHNCITKLHGQCLHAKTLGFIHPITGEYLRFDSELPEYFTHFIASLRRGTV